MRPVDADKLLDDIKAAKESGGMGAVVAGTLRRYVMRQPTLTPPNEPLTIEQLREMDGEPVWLDVADGVWALVDVPDERVWLDRGGGIDLYKLIGKVYRRPPERQEDAQ